MAFCRNCGNQLRPGANFCPACGTSVINNPISHDEEQSSSPKEGDEKKIRRKRLLTVFLIIVLLGGSFWGTRSCTPNLHCKLFSWVPFCESPSIVTYKLINSMKENDFDEVMNYVITSDYPSRALMKKNIQTFKNSSEFQTFKDRIERNITELEDFTILSEKIDGSHAIVKVKFVFNSGSEEINNINLYKDKDNVWAQRLYYK